MKQIFEQILESFKNSRAKYMKIDLGWKKYIEFEKKSEPVSVSVQKTESVAIKKSSGDAASVSSTDKSNELLSFYVGIFKQIKETLTGGERVKKGEILGTIESMGIVHEIESPIDGKIVEVNVKDKDIVEYGQLLFKVGVE